MNKISVIITNYYNSNNIKESILSVLNQNYNDIELIISYDNSTNFDKKNIEKFIKKNNKKKYEYKIINFDNKEGITKEINNTILESSGDYVLFFSSDDKLYDNSVANKLIKAFQNKNINIISSQTIFYDNKLNKNIGSYIKSFLLNKKSSKKQYYSISIDNNYNMNCIVYRKSIFKKYGLFDTKYSYEFTWPYLLKLVREGEKIYYYNCKILYHVKSNNRQKYDDILNTYSKEIINYFDRFNFIKKYKLLVRYQEIILNYSNMQEMKDNLAVFNEAKSKIKYMPLFWKISFFSRNFDKFVTKKIKTLLIYNKNVIISFLIWLLIDILFANMININRNLVLLIYILLYFAIYMIINFIINTFDFIKNKKTGGLNV